MMKANVQQPLPSLVIVMCDTTRKTVGLRNKVRSLRGDKVNVKVLQNSELCQNKYYEIRMKLNGKPLPKINDMIIANDMIITNNDKHLGPNNVVP